MRMTQKEMDAAIVPARATTPNTMNTALLVEDVMELHDRGLPPDEIHRLLGNKVKTLRVGQGGQARVARPTRSVSVETIRRIIDENDPGEPSHV